MQFGHPNPVKKLQREFEKVALTPGAGLCAQASQEWPCWGGNYLHGQSCWSLGAGVASCQCLSPGVLAQVPFFLRFYASTCW